MSIPKDILVVANKLVFVNLFEQEPVKIPMFFGDPGMPSVPVWHIWYLPWLDKWHGCCVAERLGDKFSVDNIIQLIMEVVLQILAVIVFVVKYMFAVFDRRLLSSSLTLIQLSQSGKSSRHKVMAGWWMCFLAWRWINFHNIINSMTETLAYTLTHTNTRVSCTIGGAKGLRISPFCYY